MFFCRIPLRLLLLLVLAIFCTVSADQMDLISSSDELINGPEDGSPQYTNPGSWMPTPSEADINDVGISPSMMVDGSTGAGQAENTINAIDTCANAPKNSRRGVQLRKKRQLPEWCDNKQNPAPSSATSGDSDGTNSAPTLENPITKPVLKPKPASDSQQPTTEAEESKMKDLQQVFLRLGGGGICNTDLEYFRYQHPVCFPYAMGGKGRPFALSRASWQDRHGLTLESGYLRKDVFPCRQSEWKHSISMFFLLQICPLGVWKGEIHCTCKKTL